MNELMVKARYSFDVTVYGLEMFDLYRKDVSLKRAGVILRKTVNVFCIFARLSYWRFRSVVTSWSLRSRKLSLANYLLKLFPRK